METAGFTLVLADALTWLMLRDLVGVEAALSALRHAASGAERWGGERWVTAFALVVAAIVVAAAAAALGILIGRRAINHDPPLDPDEARAMRAEMAELRRENAELRAQVRWLLSVVADGGTVQAEPPPRAPRRHLVVGVSDLDAGFEADLAVLRGVWRRANDCFLTRCVPLTTRRLAAMIERRRSGAGEPFRYVHLACHGGPEGLKFDDGRVGAQVLAEMLAGVEVLVLAACDASAVGDLLGIVPHVVTMAERLTHEQARSWTEVFWREIASGTMPEAAYYRALDRCPASVAEFVELHQ